MHLCAYAKIKLFQMCVPFTCKRISGLSFVIIRKTALSLHAQTRLLTIRLCMCVGIVKRVHKQARELYQWHRSSRGSMSKSYLAGITPRIVPRPRWLFAFSWIVTDHTRHDRRLAPKMAWSRLWWGMEMHRVDDWIGFQRPLARPLLFPVTIRQDGQKRIWQL